MSVQLSSANPFKPARFLWLTFDFASCLPDAVDDVTPQLFLTLMAHPAISQLKRFTAQADSLGPDDITQWEPGIFTLQAHRSSLLDVLTQVSSCLTPHIVPKDGVPDQVTITIYTQLGSKHYPLTTCLDSKALGETAKDIETMVSQYEQNQATAFQQ